MSELDLFDAPENPEAAKAVDPQIDLSAQV